MSSKSARKQRNLRSNAALHTRRKFLGVHLSKELREKYTHRSISVSKGDSIKVVRGQFKNKKGAVDRVDLKKSKVFVTGIEITKLDGSKILCPLEPSNLIIENLNLKDKKRLGEQNAKKTS